MFGLAVALFSQIILAKEIGKVAIIRGDAAMVRAKAENKIKIGNAVSEGDEIITQPGGYVKVVMQDRNILVVAENSKLSIDEYITAKDKKNVAITVEYGSALKRGPTRSHVAIPIGFVQHVQRPHFIGRVEVLRQLL